MTSADSRLGSVLDDRYHLVAVLGGGGSARVYLADDLRLDRKVAVKVLHAGLTDDPVIRRRFVAEARSVAAFNHPHVVTVHDWGEVADGPYLVTEYLAGGSLRATIDLASSQDRTLSVAQVVKFGYEAAGGLAAAHERGIVHRDIKPGNLLFDQAGLLRIADFGVARVLDEAALTEPDGLVLGTASYAAPERALGVHTDERSDVYSLALSMVEAATGTLPLGGGSTAEVFARRQHNDLPVPDDFGAARAVLASAGAADPELRPTARELRHGLIEATRGFRAPARLQLPGAISPAAEAAGRDALGAPGVGTDPATQMLPSSPDRELHADPSPRWRPTWRLMTAVAIVLGGLAALAAYMVSTVEPEQTPTHTVQNYEGRTIEDVRSLALANGWVVDEDQLRSNDVAVDVIMAQRPAPGTALAEGELLSVEVAVGPLLVMSPHVIGLQEDAAITRMEARGLVVVNREPVFSETIPTGEVLEMRIDRRIVLGGELVEPGTEVEFVVSGGPVPRTVAELVGLPIDQALSLVAEQQLSLVELDRVFSEEVEDGVIVSQSISPGLQIERGSEITVVVSKGPDRRIVPDVIGMTIGEATQALEEVGLVRSGVAGSGDIIDSTDPPVGTPLPPGSEVQLWAPGS